MLMQLQCDARAAAVAEHGASKLAGAVEEGAGGEHWRTVTRPNDATIGDKAAEEGEVCGSGRRGQRVSDARCGGGGQRHLMLCPRPKLNTRPKSLSAQRSMHTRMRAMILRTCSRKWRRCSYRLLPAAARRWTAAWRWRQTAAARCSTHALGETAALCSKAEVAILNTPAVGMQGQTVDS